MMRRTLMSFVFVTLVGGLGIAQSGAHYVRIRLTMPNGASPEITVREGGTASVEMPNSYKFGFIPTIKAGTSDTVIVEVVDLRQSPPKNLDTVETSVRGRPVMTKTSPQIGVHVTEIGDR